MTTTTDRQLCLWHKDISNAKAIIPQLFDQLNVAVGYASFTGENGYGEIDTVEFERVETAHCQSISSESSNLVIARDVDLNQVVIEAGKLSLREFFERLNFAVLMVHTTPTKWTDDFGSFGVITVHREGWIELEYNIRSVETVTVNF